MVLLLLCVFFFDFVEFRCIGKVFGIGGLYFMFCGLGVYDFKFLLNKIYLWIYMYYFYIVEYK